MPRDFNRKQGPRDHPAVQAWCQLHPVRFARGVVVVKETSKSQVYRLAGQGSGGAAVIAKRCPLATATVERTIYEEILPRLPISAPRYYGCSEDPDGASGWLFVEDAGEERYSPELAGHRVLVARWLGHMHTLAARLAASARLPDKGPAYYLARLRSACIVIQGLANPALAADDFAVLETISALEERLAACWQQVERFCFQMPRTLVHGDFIAKNVSVRSGRDGAEVLPFDWEQAGVGVPAADLGQLMPKKGFPNPDLPAYWSVVRECWPNLGMDDLQQLAEVGKILRCLAAIAWAAPDLAGPSIERPMARMRVYAAGVASAMQAAGLE